MSMLKTENSYMKDEISMMKEKIEDLNEENSFLLSENSKKGIIIRDLSQEIYEINKTIEIISFRDLSKKKLDNMITFVGKRNKSIFKGYTKRRKSWKY